MSKKNGKKKVGAVLVQGGGIAGVQASLDLANSGLKVYLVEKAPAIGGMMAHLDKTFPTGDCATCIVSPKLVECARNLNVSILTLSELEKLEGEPGNFKATLIKQPRYVDEDRCSGCGECTDVCPVSLSNRFDRDMGERKGIAKYNAQAVPNITGITKKGHAPCKVTCPANINVQGYVQLIKKGEYVKAVELIRERNPLSAICGRVCPAPCEAKCTRRDLDDPIAIRLLKRFASDKEIELLKAGEIELPEEKTAPENAAKVAVIGAGAAGLTAAADLADLGFAVTVYESREAAGGMLRYGIPDYRLPPDILDHEVDLIRRKGVTFKYNSKLGQDIQFASVEKDFDAVFLGVGTHQSTPLGVEGEDLDGVIPGIDFLRQSNSPDLTPDVKGKVVIIGGGDVAMDAACSALRHHPEDVTILYRRTAAEMPAIEDEVRHAQEEGVKFEYLTAPVACIAGADGRVKVVKCIRMELGEPDESGRRRPVPIEGSEFEVAADTVIPAIGQKIEPQTLENLSVETEWNLFKTDAVTMQTSNPKVFAGGDAVTGPRTVIEAVAAGKRAAESIARFLKGEELLGSRFEDSLNPMADDELPSLKKKEKRARAQVEELAVSDRKSGFGEIEGALTEEQVKAEAERCLNCAICSECGECIRACGQGAIDYFMRPQTIELDVGAVILAPGFEEFDARRKGEYGFDRISNVLTNVQFERMLSAAGPFEGHLVRRSDAKPAKRIAFIQCIGSRDPSCGNDYCSSICCMATTKQAMVASEHLDGLQVTIFNMDIRAHGKDFDQYYERARAMDNITYIKSIPSRCIELPGSRDVRLKYVGESGQVQEQDFDLVVLATGMEPTASAIEAAKRLGIELNEYNFCATDRLDPVATSREGVFVAGAFQEPKDIPETVTQASGAASKAMALLASARNTLVTQKTYPEEHDITDEEPRIGVFVCHCGMNIASVIDVEAVKEYAAGLGDVVFSTNSLYTCSDTALGEIRDIIHENRLNRVVVASCSPRTHEPLFRETLREAGLNPYLFELANIRDQASWVHADNPEAATDKAKDLVRMAVARAKLLKPLKKSSLEVNQAGLVIGGGLSGMTAALALADQGFATHLIERTDRLGGNLLDLKYTLEHDNVAEFTGELIQRVENHNRITVYKQTDIAHLAGHVGNFHITLADADNQRTEVSCGAIIVATGAGPAQTTEFLHGQNAGVLTQRELEDQLHAGSFPAQGQSIVMIQCVGSRNDEHPYCSRMCCSAAVKNALRIKQNDPKAKVYVLYRDLRTYGYREKYYKAAREAGVIFIRYDRDKAPTVAGSHTLKVTVDSPDLPGTLEIQADNVILSTGVASEPDNKRVSDMLKVPLNADGFYVEAHMKLRPVDFATEGIFLCGLAHSPKFMDENIAQARAAASRASTILSKTHLDVDAQVSVVDQTKCISCMTCVHVCPYNAPYMNYDHKGQIEAAKCMGCGICASECPACAIQLNHCENQQFAAMIEELFSSETLN